MIPVAWFGPVSRMQARPAVPDGHALHMLPCTGDGSDGGPRCQDHADAMKDRDGRRFAALRRRLKLPSGPIVAAAFSAGGQVIKRLALRPEDRRELAGVYLADATYTTAWKVRGKEAGLEPITEGFVLFAELALEEGRPFVATASIGANRDYPNGAQTLAAIRAPLDRLGPILFVDWGGEYSHGEHATAIAPVMLPRMLAELAQVDAREPAPPATTAPPATPPQDAAQGSREVEMARWRRTRSILAALSTPIKAGLLATLAGVALWWTVKK